MINSTRSHVRIPGILLTLLPAMLYGCSHNVLPEEVISQRLLSSSLTKFTNINSLTEGSTLDILTFENDSFKRLDSYQRFENFNGDTAIAESTGGEKIFFFCMNGQRTRYDWADIQSYSSLQKVRCDLEEEDHTRKTMTGECRIKAGNPGEISVEFTPLTSVIRLKSVSCDFSGTAYSDKKISNVKVYLTNVNATYPLICNGNHRAERIINAGMLNQSDLKRFHDPDIIFQTIKSDIGKATVSPGIDLLCYPNICPEDTPGTPCTRLVIEGEIESAKYYWSVTINPEGMGISRNTLYIYDICIRRKGTSDPELTINPTDIFINLNICPWKEIASYGVRF